MSITVKQLNNDQFEHLISLNIKEQLDIIDKKITRTIKKIGHNEINTTLPTNFSNIPYNKDIIVPLIYSKIMKSLESRGFSVKLQMAIKPPNLIIGWNNSVFTDKDIKENLEYVSSKIV
jgi:hypothetical protein